MTNNLASKPRLALLIATALGLGYLPKTPGTWGSLLGILLACLALLCGNSINFLAAELALIIVVSSIGVWAAHRIANHLHSHDPQIVVVDEVAGQLIAYLALATPQTVAANWKYLLAGFILFRVLDILKPFPARRAESLPGGLGIMADDWIAGGYAAVALWLARHWGL